MNKEYRQEINISGKLMERIDELIARYPSDKKKSALLPVLHAVQDAHDDWLSVPLMDRVAQILDISTIEVYEVATFYTMFNLKPMGKYLFEFCRTTCCGLRGGDELMDYTCRQLSIKPGETTPDGLFSVVGVECLGACGYGPMLQVGDYFHENMTPEKIDRLIEDCKQGKVELH